VPGTAYVLRVRAVVAGVAVEGSRAFRAAEDATRARYRAALAAIDAHVDPELRAVVCAHVALRLDLLDEAARHLDAPVPDAARALVREARDVVRRRTGKE
jgi:hypothetical protein